MDERQDAIFRKMTPQERLHVAGEMYAYAKSVAEQAGDTVAGRIERYERTRKTSQHDRRNTQSA